MPGVRPLRVGMKHSLLSKIRCMKIIGLAWLSLLLGGCAAKGVVSPPATPGTDSAASRYTLPEIGPSQKLAPGVLFHEVALPGKPAGSKLWIYLPESLTQAKVPCVIIAPAGSRLFHGMRLGEGDRAEHLPYVRAGMAVVAYEIDGPLGEEPTDREVVAAVKSFQQAEAGVANARQAIDYIVAKLPQVDASRIYSAGHSSAATLSLLVAEREPRVKACIAYAPETNVVRHLGEELIGSLAGAVAGFREFVARSSPHAGVSRLRCPLFVFHAEDDSVVPIEGTAKFAEEASKTNSSVVFVRSRSGGHYESMIAEGVPQGIAWLKGMK